MIKDILKIIIALVTFKWLFGGDTAEDGCLGCSGCGCSTLGSVILLILLYFISLYL